MLSKAILQYNRRISSKQVDILFRNLCVDIVSTSKLNHPLCCAVLGWHFPGVTQPTFFQKLKILETKGSCNWFIVPWKIWALKFCCLTILYFVSTFNNSWTHVGNIFRSLVCNFTCHRRKSQILNSNCGCYFITEWMSDNYANSTNSRKSGSTSCDGWIRGK